MFRMIEAVEAAGHTCVLYLYDRFAGEMSRHEQVIRQYWPRVRAEIRSVAEGLAPLDAYVATAWQTAHVLAVRGHVPTRRLYLVQDFEPFFYPQGSEYALAEDSYRFGFQHLAIGNMCAHLLKEKFNVDAPVAAYGCDTSVYNLTNPGRAQWRRVLRQARRPPARVRPRGARAARVPPSAPGAADPSVR